MEIHANNIHVNFGSEAILKDISIGADHRQIIGVIGPNGSGKSTLLKCMYRAIKQTSGSVLLDKEDICKIPTKKVAQKMAVVAQHNDYNFDFTINEVVLMGRTPYKSGFEFDTKEDLEIVANALATVGLSGWKDRIFSTLSGGEQQRVILARALAQKTQCLLLDEPTNHLDIKYQLEILDIVHRLNLTVICAIHDLNIALMYCDYLYVLDHGKVVAQGKSDQVLTKELIKEVYGVDVEIYVDNTNCSHILYKSLQSLL